MKNPERKIVLIGAGKMATSLAYALHDAGLPIHMIVSRTKTSAKALAQKFPGTPFSNSVSDIPSDCTHIFIAVPDNVIESVVRDLDKLDVDYRSKYIIHLSGALNSDVLISLKRKKTLTGSLHIMQSFPTRDAVSLNGCAAAIETNSVRLRKELTHIAERLNLKPCTISPENKVLYHALGVYASNFLIGNLDAMQQIFKSLNISGITVMELITPIIQATLNNASGKGIDNALSGPLERLDDKTILLHLEKLRALHLDTDYIARTLQLIPVAKRKNPTRKKSYDSLRKTLHGYKGNNSSGKT